MKIDPSLSTEPLVPVSLRICDADIAEMDYHFNECPMSNPAQQNAVAFAIRRVVKPGLPVAVHIARDGARAEIGRCKYPLGNEVATWLGKVLTGCRVQPVKFKVLLPEKALIRSVPFSKSPPDRSNRESAELVSVTV